MKIRLESLFTFDRNIILKLEYKDGNFYFLIKIFFNFI